MRVGKRAVLLLTVVLAMLFAFSGVVLAQQDRAARDTKTLPERASTTAKKAIPGSYVVTLKEDIDQRPKDVANDLARQDGFSVKHDYKNALKGFSARLSSQQVERLKADSRVASVEEDTVMEAFQAIDRKTPTGYQRSGADQSPASLAAQGTSLGINVAVLDTGIDLGQVGSPHPDLPNAQDGYNCISPPKDDPNSGQTKVTPAEDDHGHGTHVAGTIGAKPDTINGVVGIASGTPLYAVKVLDSAGSGSLSSVLCGIDWVTGKNTDSDTANDIKVANMSLGGSGSDSTVDSNCLTPASAKDSYHEAICRSVKSGATYVVAAGNGSTNFSATRPASRRNRLRSQR